MNLKNADYDFKDQVETFRNCGNDHLYKFLVYKSDTSPFDCDRSEYAKEIYQCLWGFDPEGYNFQNITVGNKSILMGMDTINSFWTTFAWSLNRWCKNDLQKYFGISYVNANSIPYFLQNYGALVQIIRNNLSEEIYQMFQAFAKLTHTLGNFTLVPKKVQPHIPERQSFNQARASKWNDYFDLSLLWLQSNTDPDWGEETFRAYIDRFFLNGYVTQQYQIVGFTSTHQQILSGNQNLDNRPQTKQELLQYLQVVCSLIQQRGNRMYQILCGNHGAQTFYEEQRMDSKNDTLEKKRPEEIRIEKEQKGERIVEQREQLLGRLNEVSKLLHRISALRQKKEETQAMLQQHIPYFKERSLWIRVVPVVVLFLTLFDHPLIAVGGFLVYGYYRKCYDVDCASRNQKVEQQNAQIQNQLAVFQKEIDTVCADYARNCSSWYPKDYSYMEAVDFFIHCIENYRAETLKEAINLYEEELHRRRVEEAHKEMIHTQHSMTRNQEQMIQQQDYANELARQSLNEQRRSGASLSAIRDKLFWG
ncbi:MAG: hypothetical protein ACI4HI_14700 [Lachnospiraceae bacterium]